MGLGGYLAAQSEADHYKSEKRREEREVVECPEEEEEECYEVLAEYGITREVLLLSPSLATCQSSLSFHYECT